MATALSALPALGAQAPDRAGTPGESNPVRLEPFVTTATRTPARPTNLGTDVQVISSDELAAEQIDSVAGALGQATAAPLFASGAPGSVASLFLRGANSNQTLFLVDGIRLNDPNTDYQMFLGGATLGAGDTIEIARGPQSTLYGGEAIGGVVSLSRVPGTGPVHSSIGADGGSYGTINGSIGCRGSKGADAWSFSATTGHTDNARPNNRFESANVALRLDHRVDSRWATGGTVRWYDGHLGSPGDIFTNDPNNRETESNLLATAFADAKLATDWTAHVILGGQNRRYTDYTPAPNPPYDSPTARNVVTNRRAVLDAQTTYAGVESNRVTAGITGEANQTRNNGFGAIDNHQRLFAAFAEDEFAPIDTLHLTAGLRNDDFDTFGRATTGRGTVAWDVLPRTLKLRASYGTGFRSPSFLDLYGKDPYYVGNPSLRPERSRGADAGIDWYLPQGRGTLSATWFETDFSNLIEYDYSVFPSTAVNVGKARTRGVEFTAAVILPGSIIANLGYTYLDARSLSASGNTELLRRPRHEISADVHRSFCGEFIVGAGAQLVGRRADIDAQTYATITDGSYSVVRLYGAWRATERLTVKARVENALDRHYEPVNGYPALGATAFAGVDWAF